MLTSSFTIYTANKERNKKQQKEKEKKKRYARVYEESITIESIKYQYTSIIML